MKVLLVGSGGREHALAWKLCQSPRLERLFVLPGNAGMEGPRVERVPLNPVDTPGILRWAVGARPDLAVIGPEAPLAAGLADVLREKGVQVFGPGASAARLESSKIFAKEFMSRSGIPTAPFSAFDDPERARAHISSRPYETELVVKADGLAAGKGVRLCANRIEALQAVSDWMDGRVLGEAGRRLVIEERLEGKELSMMALCDGTALTALPPCRDHKRAFDGDEGPNTGGMGALAPCPVDSKTLSRIEREVFDRFLQGLRSDGLEYRGLIYFGLMLTAEGPKALEFNVRFGDPETQAALPLIEGDLLDALSQTAAGRLAEARLSVRPGAAVCVVMASEGYPGFYKSGKPIMGLEEAKALVFHAGTDRVRGRWVTGGGRVLGVTGLGPSLEAARAAAYESVDKILFEGRMFRTDIAAGVAGGSHV